MNDSFAVRVAMHSEHRDSLFDSLTSDPAPGARYAAGPLIGKGADDERHLYSIRFGARWKPTDSFDAVFKLDYDYLDFGCHCTTGLVPTTGEEEDLDNPIVNGKHHYIDRRVRRLNELGFDVAEMQIAHSSNGDTVTFVPKVVDAGHHQRQLLRLTGLDAEENQARRLLNDLETWMATQEDYAPGDPLAARPEVLAHRWVREVFRPTVRAVPRELRGSMDAAELYHELLEHRWYLSERAQHDIGLDMAVEDYVKNILPKIREKLPAPDAAASQAPSA